MFQAKHTKHSFVSLSIVRVFSFTLSYVMNECLWIFMHILSLLSSTSDNKSKIIPPYRESHLISTANRIWKHEYKNYCMWIFVRDIWLWKWSKLDKKQNKQAWNMCLHIIHISGFCTVWTYNFERLILIWHRNSLACPHVFLSIL